jgi:hypothetical protein
MAAATATAMAADSKAVTIRRIRLRRCSRRHRSSNANPSRPAIKRIRPLCSPSPPPSLSGLRSGASGVSVRPSSIVVRRSGGKHAVGTPDPISGWIAPSGRHSRNSAISRGTQDPGAIASACKVRSVAAIVTAPHRLRFRCAPRIAPHPDRERSAPDAAV